MPNFRESGLNLDQARKAEEEARLRLHRSREDLAGVEEAQAALNRHIDEESDSQRTQRAALRVEAAELREAVATGRQNVTRASANVIKRFEEFQPFSDPRKGVSDLDASVPTLLFPVRIETRFVEVGDGENGHQLWVRVYPDDCLVDTFEPTLSNDELASVRDFWVAWAKAGGIPDQERGAWRILAGDLGSGRAAWLVEQHRPVNLDALPAKADEADVFLVVAVEASLPTGEVSAVADFWSATWLAGDDRAAQDAALAQLVAAVGEARAGEIVDDYEPVNLTDEELVAGAHVEIVFLELPEAASVPTQRQSWSQPAVARGLPERFVLLGYRDDIEVLNQIGAPIPASLAIGPDPLAEPGDQIHQDGSELAFGDDLKWLVDFDEAVRVGMGFRVDLSTVDVADGYDQLMVLGVRLSADQDEGKDFVETLFFHHQQGTAGFSLIPTGAATNNTETQSSSYGASEDPDQTFDLTFGKLPPLSRTGDYMARLDGQWLADALGIDLALLDKTPNSRGRDMCEARAMNTVLWPATWGYLMESMMGPVFDEDTIEQARWFFTHFVTGRGLAPAIRIGDQPYGILPTTVLSRMTWLDAERWTPPAGLPHPKGFRSFLSAINQLFGEMREDWEQMSKDVAFVGKTGDQHQILLDIVGLSPASVEYHRRWAESLEQLANRLKLEGLGGALILALIALAYTQSGMQLLERLGYGGDDLPEVLEKFFLDAAKVISGDLVDDRPLSEVNPIRDWTAGGDNYIEWLIEAAETSFERLRKQEGFIDGKPPRALLYLLLRYALEQGYWDASLRILGDAGRLSKADLATARIDPSFVHVTERPGSDIVHTAAPATVAEGLHVSNKPIHFDRPSESRYEYLYRTAPDQDDMVVAELIPSIIGSAPGARYLASQLDALRHLKDAPTARLERAMAEHLDLGSYRLDAWRWGLVHYQLAALREGRLDTPESTTPKQGLYVGAFGWLENVKPEQKSLSPVALGGELDAEFNADDVPPAMRDSANQGYIHAPSLNHAVAAAILRNGYLSNATPQNPDALAVNLSSARVRTALGVLEGLRNGQSLGALLGYRLERGMHDRHTMAEVDRFIYELRRAFPLVADHLKDTEAPPGEPIEAVEARNVVDGLALVRHIRKSGEDEYPFDKAGLPVADSPQSTVINAEVNRLLDIHDAIADLATSEATYQAVLGNYERTSATLEAFSQGTHAPEPEVIQTPRSGISLTHRVGLQFESGLDPVVSPNPVPVTPRVLAEPALNTWLNGVLPQPANVTCLVEYTDPDGTEQGVAVSQQDLGLQPLDLLHLLDPEIDQAMAELDDRIEEHVMRTESLRPDVAVRIRYNAASPSTLSFFEVGAVVRTLRSLVLRSRPLTPADVTLSDEAADMAAPLVSVDEQRIQAPLERLNLISQDLAADDLTELAADMAPLLTDTVANEDSIVAQAEGWSARYVALARKAAAFDIDQAAFGFVLDGRRLAYSAVLEALDDLLERWQQRIVDYGSAVGEAQTLPTAEEQFEALRGAERLVTTEFSSSQPGTPGAYIGQLDGRRDQFNARRIGFAAIRQNPAAAVGGVLAAIAAEPPVDAFDEVGVDLSRPRALLIRLATDVQASVKALAAEASRRAAAANAKLADAAATANASDVAERRVEAAQALFGDHFKLVPEYLHPTDAADEIDKAWGDRDKLLRHLTDPEPGGLGIDFPVDDWLYGAARVREKLGLWEHLIVSANALETAEPSLTPLQLPYRADDVWLGLRFPDDYDHEGDRLAYTAHFAVPFDKTAKQCGLLIDEWTEVIPTKDETTGVAFHYDRPSTEPPQVLLLALSPTMTGTWRWVDLVDSIRETFAEARLRAVEPTQVDDGPYARFLPSAIMAATLHPITIGLNLATNSNIATATVEDSDA